MLKGIYPQVNPAIFGKITPSQSKTIIPPGRFRTMYLVFVDDITDIDPVEFTQK
jgi:hypothetical protein